MTGRTIPALAAGGAAVRQSTGEVPWVAVARGGDDPDTKADLTVLIPSEPGAAEVELGHADEVILAPTRGELRAQGWGGCRPEPVLPRDSTWVELQRVGAVDPGSTTVPVQISEHACTGGRDPGPHLDEPYVVEDDTSVVVCWRGTGLGGFATCPGNPTVERTLTLKKPLGDRELLDGSTYPPRPVR